MSEDNLKLILSLPCIVNDEIPLLKTPLLSKATYLQNGLFHHKLNGRTVTEFLKDIYENKGTYEMDCAVFWQLSHRIFSGWNCDSSFSFTLYTKENFQHLWTSKPENVCYISLIQRKACDLIQTLPTSAKGIWAIKLEQGYLGLHTTGPKIFSMKEWCLLLKKELVDYLEKARFNTTEASILYCMFKMSPFTTWGAFHKANAPTNCINI